MLTIQLWVKVIIGSIPAMLIGLPFNDFIEEKFNNSYVVAATLIIYGILFIVIENYQKDKQPKVEKLSQLTIQTVLIIGVFQALAHLSLISYDITKRSLPCFRWKRFLQKCWIIMWTEGTR